MTVDRGGHPIADAKAPEWRARHEVLKCRIRMTTGQRSPPHKSYPEPRPTLASGLVVYTRDFTVPHFERKSSSLRRREPHTRAFPRRRQAGAEPERP